ncbi:hypothetical protein BDV23DRAFT_183811 [Aspergillus alliaceus]|uniref:Uncharacterized protein n=1 Tax=Petromyces alliaceus TaxID=209559 RepID=A0A5N7C7L2_PETAA|nr:hypothetical protein BDV23DRAFT_183811 [Aspergillus alliaceus]
MVLLSRVFISALTATWRSVSAHTWRAAIQPNAAWLLALHAYETIETIFDVAGLYSLSSSSKFNVVAESALEYAASNMTDSFSWASYKSKTLSINVPKSEEKSLLQKRAKLGGCSGDKAQTVKDSITCATKIASAGADSAKKPSDLSSTFFKTDENLP